MHRIERIALVEYSAEQMFDLVNDIEQYPRFMPGCVEARLISVTADEMVGELCLARAGIRQRFTTRNRLVRPQSITMSLVEGDFSRFSARWEFISLGAAACKVTFTMEFDFKSRLLGLAAAKLFAGVAGEQMDAVVRRARELYG